MKAPDIMQHLLKLRSVLRGEAESIVIEIYEDVSALPQIAPDSSGIPLEFLVSIASRIISAAAMSS